MWYVSLTRYINFICTVHDYFFIDFQRRFLSLLAFQFSLLPATLSLSILHNKENDKKATSGVL